MKGMNAFESFNQKIMPFEASQYGEISNSKSIFRNVETTPHLFSITTTRIEAFLIDSGRYGEDLFRIDPVVFDHIFSDRFTGGDDEVGEGVDEVQA